MCWHILSFPCVFKCRMIGKKPPANAAYGLANTRGYRNSSDRWIHAALEYVHQTPTDMWHSTAVNVTAATPCIFSNAALGFMGFIYDNVECRCKIIHSVPTVGWRNQRRRPFNRLRRQPNWQISRTLVCFPSRNMSLNKQKTSMNAATTEVYIY